MSEAVTNSEIEGVLTSIRRLVGVGYTNANHDAGLSDVSNGSGGALMLTADLRVDSQKVLQLRPEQAVVSDQEVETDIPLAETHNTETFAAEVPRQSSQDVQDLIAKITALETAIANTVDEWEPDDTGRDAYAGTVLPAMSWGESLRLDANGIPLTQEPRLEQDPAYEMAEAPAPFSHSYAAEPVISEPPAIESAAEDQSGDEDLYEEELLDENTLRALIAEVVREELQGEVGQRLSRNIRKLIRQEIQRALVADELS